MMNYNFPATKFVFNTSDFQIEHVLSEVEEMKAEVNKIGHEMFRDMEMMDLWHSIETYFRIREREVSKIYVDGLKMCVVDKNKKRGYYGEAEGTERQPRVNGSCDG